MRRYFLESVYLYPILFPANVILSLAAANLVNLTYFEIIEYTLAVCIIAGALLGIMYRINRDMQRNSFLLFIFTLWISYFSVVVSLIKKYTGLPMSFSQQILSLLVWTVFFGFLSSSWIWKRIQRPGAITSYMNLLTIVLILLSIYRIRTFVGGQLDVANFEDRFPELQNLEMPTRSPDIYYIILDGYGQAGVLSDLYKWDNSEFIKYLTEKGFYIASESQTNYVQTALSISSSLNFDYLPSLPENSRDGRVLIYYIQHSRLVTTLNELGYTTYTFQTPYEATNITQADHYFSGVKTVRINELLGLLMMNSVVSPFVDLGIIKVPLPTYGQQQNLVLSNLAELVAVAKKPGPKFIFLHLLIPHPPFIFDAQGALSPNNPYILTDAELYQGTLEQYINGYTSQIKYLNHALEEVLTGVIENSPTKPIIILQGDHGPGAMFRQTVNQSCLEERFGILNAYLLPGVEQSSLYPLISPVNTFRLVFDDYFGANLGLLPDNHYYSNFAQPYKYTQIENDFSANCSYP